MRSQIAKVAKLKSHKLYNCITLQQTFRGPQVAKQHTAVVRATAVEECSVQCPLQIVSPEDVILGTVTILLLTVINIVHTYNRTNAVLDDDVIHICCFQGNMAQGVGSSIEYEFAWSCEKQTCTSCTEEALVGGCV